MNFSKVLIHIGKYAIIYEANTALIIIIWSLCAYIDNLSQNFTSNIIITNINISNMLPVSIKPYENMKLESSWLSKTYIYNFY